MLEEVLEHLFEHDLDAIRVPGQLFPLRSLALDEVLGLLVLQLHLRAHLLEADAQRLLIEHKRHRIADVVHFESRAILDGASMP